MSLRNIAVLVLALTFCGCEAQKAAEPQKAPVNKDTPAQMKGNVATVSEPP